ncbi:hypothetical protein D3C81_2156020 [compost metagenome]
MIEAEHIGILQHHAGTGAAGGRHAGIVQIDRGTPHRLVNNCQRRFDLIILLGRFHAHRHLLGRILIGQLQALGNRLQVRCLSFMQRR